MIETTLNVLSLRSHYLCAATLYIGLGLLVLGIMPEIPKAFACDITCPEGQVMVPLGEGCECQCPE
ncbi:hypothetical protein FACS189427_12790 [Planctomycetales bacterium]|nr:hypothetical protein FACS189427_12790 [Planctomycetales bacterium]